MVVAGLPAIRSSPTLSQDAVDALAEQLAMGYHPRDIARSLHPKAGKNQQKAKRRIEKLIREDARIYEQVLDHAKMDLASGVGPAMRGLVKRARAGNPQAARLILEISGLHNPRVKHEHKGDIKIKIDGMPRPSFERAAIDDSIPDATVVD